MFKSKFVFWAGVLLLTVGLLAGCSPSGEAAKEKSSEEEVKTEDTDEQNNKTEEEVKSENTDEQDSKTEEESESEKEEEAEANSHVINVSAFEMGYDPKEITLNKGEEYELIMDNEGEIFHDLTQNKMDVKITYMSEMADHPEEVSLLDQVLGVSTVHASGTHDGGHKEDSETIHMNATSGQTVRIKFIPQEKGTFEFFCSVPGHKEAGMVGSFIVE
ncbi:plastocyanin/azurin family copper-binding protein [Salimicrobium flavidum]|uniref:Copper binding protein, plastocyanin/azurin family n=1 Tax=Salimicrobium flavidum TaxID=570947 RepID=A0A1N7KSH2_9BACI|nr:plastocyanin/azurin family copper-binding protein [Salimicrobium flavidum]SIS64558.1 Copper binding protein, plastocyanin/azurin family [Salimicrobium flavidum]